MGNKLELLSLAKSPPLSPVSPPSAAPPWTELPSDVTANILQRLGALEILQSAQLVCATWWKVCHDPAMWRAIKIETTYLDDDELTQCHIACRRAVDRSQGQLVDLHITCNGDEGLLDYIANRSSHLRRLTLRFYCGVVSGAIVAEAVKKLPELEEFRLLSAWKFGPEHIESIAASCPSLKSFALNLSLARIPDVNPILSHVDYAVAISKFMPNLQHLQLDDCEMGNRGLEAILDGCLRLQSLDLRGCCWVDLNGALGERCRAQIKDLVIPLRHSISYYTGNIYYDDDSGYNYDDDRGYDDDDHNHDGYGYDDGEY